jgi:hypothetical protein
MIRGKRNDAYGRQTLRVDCCGWESYREAVSYIIRHIPMWFHHVISHPPSPKKMVDFSKLAEI